MRTYPDPPNIEAEITYVPTEKGGRSTPVFARYRPQFYYDGENYDAEHVYPDVESVFPGQTARALLYFARPDIQVGRIHVGMEFEIREGARIVAHGRVTEILHFEERARKVKK